MTLFPGFSAELIETSGTRIHVLRKGNGTPLLLLHGYPETHVTWHKIAPQLAERFSVYVPDLRGYGNSGKPEDGERHENYSFRAMAQDQADVMHHYGHGRFLVAAHDRGARVAHRLCLDHPESVKTVCLMDIAPTLTMYRGTNQEPGAIGPDAMSEYVRAFSNAAAIYASCEDFRAAADIDLEMDKADEEAGKKIGCPLHVLWGAKGTVGSLWDIVAAWREKSAASVTGRVLDCGHFLAEERPQDVLAELFQLFLS